MPTAIIDSNISFPDASFIDARLYRPPVAVLSLFHLTLACLENTASTASASSTIAHRIHTRIVFAVGAATADAGALDGAGTVVVCAVAAALGLVNIAAQGLLWIRERLRVCRFSARRR